MWQTRSVKSSLIIFPNMCNITDSCHLESVAHTLCKWSAADWWEAAVCRLCWRVPGWMRICWGCVPCPEPPYAREQRCSVQTCGAPYRTERWAFTPNTAPQTRWLWTVRPAAVSITAHLRSSNTGRVMCVNPVRSVFCTDLQRSENGLLLEFPDRSVSGILLYYKD